MEGASDLRFLIANMEPIINEGSFVFCSVKSIKIIPNDQVISFLKEDEGITVVLSKEVADTLQLEYHYVSKWITLRVHSSLNAVGLTAIVSSELAKHNISCNMVAGYYHDHIFVPSLKSEKAINLLNDLSQRNKK